MSPATTTRSARELLVAWANQQDGWVRAIVSEVLASRRQLSADAVDHVKDVFLAEKQLGEGDAPDVPLLGDVAVDDETREPLRLIALRDCRGVNALAEGQAVQFNPRVTILFGENATGKSGYVRVLKRVANVRSAEPILPDVHRVSAAPSPRAVLQYALGEEEHELAWAGETGVVPLTRMSVFDTPAVALHLEDNVTYVYTPAELALFRYVHAAIEAVRERLEADRTAREPRGNPFLTAFNRGTPIYTRIEQLGPSTDVAELEQLATIGDAELVEIDALKVSVEALSAATSAGHGQMLRGRIAVLEHLRTVAEAAARYSADDLAAALAERETASAVQGRAAAAVFGSADPPAEVLPAWQAFVEAGETYLRSSGRNGYPQADDGCIYCRQPLDDSAAALLRTYREYASGAAAAAARAAATKVATGQAPLVDYAVDAALSTLSSLLPGIEASEEPPAWAGEGRRLVVAIEAARQHFAKDGGISAPPTVSVPPTLVGTLTAALRETEATLTALEGDAQERAARLRDQRTRLATLESRMRLAHYLPEVRAFVESARWTSRLKSLLGRFQGVLRQLTETSKVASTEVLNRNFERAFYEECAALRAPNVVLDFPGRRGQAARRKTVTSDHSLTDILSEGEQKVIAVADFLAEASFRGGSAPVVFDDPVNSLDYRRLHEIVRRIVALSDDHQVVVFTHNIWFASELLSQFDDRPADCSLFQIVDRSGVKGLVTGGSNLRADTERRIKGRINKAIQETRAAADGERARRVEDAYDDVRAWCELVVEGDLLGGVAKRYQPNVAMTNLSRIKPERLADAIAVILPIFERACRYIRAHSQPMETLGVRPTVEELEDDWQRLQDARKQYLG